LVEKAARFGLEDVEAEGMEKYRQQRAHIQELSAMLHKKMDSNGNGTVSLEEFNEHIHDKEFVTFCLTRDISIRDIDMFFHMLLANGDTEIRINTFAKSIVRLRWHATAIDIQFLHHDLKKMHQDLVNLECQTQYVEKEILNQANRIENLKNVKPPVALSRPQGQLLSL